MSKSDIDEQLREIIKKSQTSYSGTEPHRMAGWGFGDVIGQINDLFTAKFEACLPEKKDAKAPYDILELEKAFQNGRSQAIDQSRDSWYKG